MIISALDDRLFSYLQRHVNPLAFRLQGPTNTHRYHDHQDHYQVWWSVCPGLKYLLSRGTTMAVNTGGVTPSVGEAEVLILHHFLEDKCHRKFRVKYLISGVAVFPVVRFNIKCVPCSSKWPFPNQLIKVNLRQQLLTFWWHEAKRYCRWNPDKHVIINGSIKTLRLRASKTSFVSRISLYYRILMFSFWRIVKKRDSIPKDTYLFQNGNSRNRPLSNDLTMR